MNAINMLPYVQLLLALGNLSIMIYALSKFLSKPHDTLIDRVTKIEVKLEELDQSLKQGNDRFREQHTTNEVLINSLLALIEFEMQYCIEEKKPVSKGLEKAKEDLHSFLSKR